MAKTEAKRARKAAIKAEESGEPLIEPAVISPEAQHPEPERRRAAAPPPRPPKRDTPPKYLEFFRRLSTFPLEDWGTRVTVRVYRLEPITNQLIGSSKKYVMVYTQPPVTEERLKHDCGSGRYRLYLNYKAPQQGDKELDSTEIDILDLNFPPKVPKGAWLDDPRNAQWAWAKETYDKQSAPPAAASQQTQMLDTIETVLDVAERLRPPEQPDPVSTTLKTIEAVKGLFPAADGGKSDAMMNLLNTVVTNQLAQAQQQTNELRAEIRELRQQGQNGRGSGLGGFKEILTEVKDIFGVQSIRDLIGAGKEAINNTSRSRMSGWQEFVVSIAPQAKEFLSPFAMIAMQMAMARNGGAPGPQPNPGAAAALPAPGASAGGGPVTMMPFLQMIAVPLLSWARPMAGPDPQDPAEAGESFAAWVFDGFGDNPNYQQAMVAARAMGPIGIVAAFRSTPLWQDKGPAGNLASLQDLEPRLQGFFRAFLDWNPNAESDDEPQESDPAVPEVLTYSEAADGAGY